MSPKQKEAIKELRDAGYAEWLRPSNTNGMSIAHEPWEQMDVFMVVLRRSKPKSRKSNVKH
jgi:hypothetical protein